MEPERANGAGVHEGLLESLARHPTKRSVQVGHSLEPKLAEAPAETRPHRLPRVETAVLLVPCHERLCDRLWHVVEAAGGLEGELLAQVPVRGVSVQKLPRELDQDYASVRPQQGVYALDRSIEVVDVVQRPARDDGIEWSGF